MRVFIVAVFCCLALPAAAQLTAAGQVNRLCAQLNKNAEYSPSHAAQITAACGTPAAIEATLAGGNSAFVSLRSLHSAVMADFNAVLATGQIPTQETAK